MKKLLLLSAVSLNCLSYAVQAMESEDFSTTENPSTQLTVQQKTIDPSEDASSQLAGGPQATGTTEDASKTVAIKRRVDLTISEEGQTKIVNQMASNPIMKYLFLEAFAEVTSGNSQGTSDPFHDAFHQILQRIVIEDPSSLPSIMKTCKDWSIATKDFQEATTSFFRQIYTSDNPLNTWFDNSHAYKTKDKQYNHMHAFKLGFKQHIFKLGPDRREKEVLLPTYKALRHFLFIELLNFPKNIQDDFSDRFAPQTPCESLQFSYMTAFCLNKAQRKISSKSLEKIYACFKTLRGAITKTAEDLEEYGRLFNSIKSMPPTSTVEENFKAIHLSMLALFKLVLIENGYSQRFFTEPPSLITAEEMQKIPVNFLTIATDIKQLDETIEKQILDLAQRRWKILKQLEWYTIIG